MEVWAHYSRSRKGHFRNVPPPLAMRGNGVSLLTRERVKVRAKVDNLIVLHAAIRKSPILKAEVAATPVLVVQLPPFKLNSPEYLLALNLFGMIFTFP